MQVGKLVCFMKLKKYVNSLTGKFLGEILSQWLHLCCEKYADSVHTITFRAINYISKCSSQNALLNTAINMKQDFLSIFYQNCFKFQLSKATQFPKLHHPFELIAITSHKKMFSFAQRFIFRILSFNPCWRSVTFYSIGLVYLNNYYNYYYIIIMCAWELNSDCCITLMCIHMITVTSDGP